MGRTARGESTHEAPHGGFHPKESIRRRFADPVDGMKQETYVDRDLRPTPLYQEIEAHFQRALAPAFGRISGAADPAPSPDGRHIAFTGSRMERLDGLPATRVCLLDLQTDACEEITGGPN